ncbi:MAG: dihydroorotate dehydrogenase-like protein [Puniceicoccaceae bacterium]|nr:MAG: dihydroorotate dehydrogenase-like protein [Puniceicoccaceae bacterium]
MDLATTYLGLPLKHPLMPGASPLVDDLDVVRRLEDAGASAIVMHSLFEEQIVKDELAAAFHRESHEESFAEATSYLPWQEDFALGPDQYLEQIRRLKEAVAIPVIASLNGTRPGGWLDYARLIEKAGADALELNLYLLAMDATESSEEVEQRSLEIVREVTRNVKIPVAVKLSAFYTSLSYFATELDALGVRGLVLFNRFYQPDIDLENLEVKPHLELSTSSELLLRLRWLAILHGRVRASLAVTGGVHTARDAIKAVMCGASAVQMTSALLHHGPGHLAKVLTDLTTWLEVNEYDSLRQMQGSMSLAHCPDPSAFERTNYLRTLQLWKV